MPTRHKNLAAAQWMADGAAIEVVDLTLPESPAADDNAVVGRAVVPSLQRPGPGVVQGLLVTGAPGQFRGRAAVTSLHAHQRAPQRPAVGAVEVQAGHAHGEVAVAQQHAPHQWQISQVLLPRVPTPDLEADEQDPAAWLQGPY